MIELVAAMALLGVTISCFAVLLRQVGDLEKRYARQQTALLVLDNALERFAAEPARNAAALERILKQEFSESELAVGAAFSPVVESTGEGGLLAAIRNRTGGTAARIVFKP